MEFLTSSVEWGAEGKTEILEILGSEVKAEGQKGKGNMGEI